LFDKEINTCYTLW